MSDKSLYTVTIYRTLDHENSKRKKVTIKSEHANDIAREIYQQNNSEFDTRTFLTIIDVEGVFHFYRWDDIRRIELKQTQPA